MNLKSVGTSHVFFIKLDDFLEVIQDFPVDKEIFCYIRDNIALHINYELANINCISCLKNNH